MSVYTNSKIILRLGLRCGHGRRSHGLFEFRSATSGTMTVVSSNKKKVESFLCVRYAIAVSQILDWQSVLNSARQLIHRSNVMRELLGLIPQVFFASCEE